MNEIIISSGIFYPIPLFCQMQKFENIYLEQFEHYQKRSYRNRYNILTSNGVQQLSIPLKKGKNNQLPIRDVRISYDENWVASQIQSIRSAYGKSPYFEFYFPVIEQLWHSKPNFLFDLNLEALYQTFNLLKWEKNIHFSDSFKIDYPDSIDFRNSDWPVENLDKSQNSQYTQVWNNKFSYTKNLSILDLIFCTGPEAEHFLYSAHI